MPEVPRNYRSHRHTVWAWATLALEALGLALGAITFAADPLGFPAPALALYGMASLTAVALVAHALPALRARPRLAHSIEVAALFLYATLLTLSTGATSSPFIALYALALFAAALGWKVWQVAALAFTTVGLTLLQSGFLDSMNDLHLFTTIMLLLDAVAPAAAAAVIIAACRQRILAAALLPHTAADTRRSTPSAPAACSVSRRIPGSSPHTAA
jgi:hypothetical protein